MNMEILDHHRRAITREEINELPLFQYSGEVTVIDSVDDVADAVAILRRTEVLGFDTETRPAFQKGRSYPPALLQLAGSDGVFLFRLGCTKLPAVLADLLADTGIVKAGVACKDDLKELRKLAPFTPGKFVDLGDEARRLGLKTHGLRNLAANFLGVRVSKSARTSNWSAPVLTPQQIAYAAADAWISREIHRCMQERNFF